MSGVGSQGDKVSGGAYPLHQILSLTANGPVRWSLRHRCDFGMTRSQHQFDLQSQPWREPSSWHLGYCTNIHPGTDVESIVGQLESISTQVRRLHHNGQTQRGEPTSNLSSGSTTRSNNHKPLPIGLWLPSEATRQLRRHGLDSLQQCLRKHHLLPYTINGFPYANFHAERVKHDVYHPTWWDDERLAYTRDLAKVLSELLPEDVMLGSISTLPLGWPTQKDADGEPTPVSEAERHHAGTNLRRLAEDLRMLENRTGKRIVVGIEPEPGCLLDTSGDVVAWFDAELPDPSHRRYLGVCHDVCHAAVMNETQMNVLTAYAEAEIMLTKMQISSAIVADWQSIAPESRQDAWSQISSFAEDRYLHQTGRIEANQQFTLFDDLPELLASELSADDHRWVTHFHVPVFTQSFGQLYTTQSAVIEALDAWIKQT
ncbi:MAG: metabolite traffic protein EboE, partial [Planctomycetota bacterium]